MEKVFTKSPYICAPNIMDHPDYVAKQMELVDTGADCIPAGSPINAAGQVANDETAIGILLQDCHTCLGAHRGMVVIEGRIKQDVAAEHSGITISDKAKAALVNISFTGDGERMGGGGSSVTVDSELSDTSTNPVQNKVVKVALDGKLEKSGIASKTSNMTQSVGVDDNGALWTSPGSGGGSVTVDSELSDTSTNPVQNKVVKAALDALSEATVTDEHINSLIDTKLGVIENGAY